MTDPDKLVKAGLKLLKDHGLPPIREEGAREALLLALMETAHDFESWERVVRSKEFKNGLKKWNLAARKLLVVQRELNELVEDDWVASLHLKQFGFEELEQRIRTTLKETELLASRPSGKTDSYKLFKKIAAREALSLIHRYDLSDAVTAGGLFCRLAAILSYDPKADLYHQCRDAKNARAVSGLK